MAPAGALLPRRGLAAGVVPRCGGASRRRGQQAAGSRWETIAVNNPLLLHVAVHVGYFRESKPKFLSPKSFSTMAEITPTTIFFVEKPETSENQTGFAP